MSLAAKACGGWLEASRTSDVSTAGMGLAFVGLATAMSASAAQAQQTAEPAPLPPVEVTAAKKKAKAAPSAQKKAPVAKQAATPVAAPPADEVDAQPAVGSGNAFTPASGNTNQAETGIGRLPGSIQSTPQVVNVVPQQQLQQQNSTSIDRALRNVPGITVSSGEGGGGFTGDQFRIRGIEAKGDLYIDGLRDFGVYARDSFATQEIQVLKGPSSESFGVGTTGGVINLRQKSAHLGDSYSFDVSVGTDSLFRSVIDVNKQVSDTIAMRAVGLYHDQDQPDRDHVFSERYGFLGSIGFGLGTDQTWAINYLHQTGEARPDYGVPLVFGAGANPGTPVTELGVPRDTFYGRAMDHDDTQVDMVTSLYKNKVNENVTFHNDTRLAIYSRDIAASVPNCGNATNVPASTCSDVFLGGGNPQIAYGGGNPTYDQDAWTIQNVMSVVTKFKTAHLRHEAAFGVDLSYQDDDRHNYTVTNKTAPTIRNPELLYNTPYTVTRTAVGGDRSGQGTNAAAFVSDRVWLTPEFSVLGGVRWDYFKSEFQQNTAIPVDRETEVDIVTPKASLIWEPTRTQTYYASYSQSAAPVGQFVTNSLNPIGNDPSQNLVEDSESYELGAKYSLLGGKLGLTAAIFQVTKGNAVFIDPATNVATFSGEEQRVRGAEIGISGQLTPAWSVFAGYTYLDTEILDSATAANVGNHIGGVPEHSASLWTTYNLSKYLVSGPGEWTVGGGATYSDEMFTLNNSANQFMLPVQYTIDAMVSYELNGWRAAVNGYNLTDHLNYDASFNQRAVPSAGRSVVVSVGKKF